jgi:hypothetical protein
MRLALMVLWFFGSLVLWFFGSLVLWFYGIFFSVLVKFFIIVARNILPLSRSTAVPE